MTSTFKFFGTFRAAALALACVMVVQCVFVLIHTAAGEPWSGWMGLNDVSDNGGVPAGVVVGSVKSGSAADKAGIRAGDILTFDHPTDRLRGTAVDEPIGVTVSRGGHVEHLVIKTSAVRDAPLSGTALSIELANMFANLVIALLAVFTLLRAGQSRALLALGAALTFMSDELYFVPASRIEFGPLVDILAALDRIFYGGGTVLLVYFVVQFAKETVGGLGPWPARAVRAYVLTFFAVVACRSYLDLAGQGAWWPFDATFGIGGVLMWVFVLMGYRKSTGQTRVRYVMLMSSFLLLFIAQLLMMMSRAPGIWQSVGFSFVRKASFDAFVFMFAYAILRHRVVNLGFVLSRSIVYAVISAMLLVGFGVVEWLAEHLIHFEDREKSVLLDGGIALGVYLVFHRVRHSVEHGVERLFFHHWHVNEAQLRRFIQEANYIVNAENLLQSFCVELARFSGGAPGAVYIVDDSGIVFRHVASIGNVQHPTMIDGDDPAVLALELQRAHVSLDETRSQLPYLEAFPFFHRGRLLGMAMLAAKPNGGSYRPDELAILAWASQQIGLHHQAVTLVSLERSVGEMSHLLSTRNAEIALLREVLRDTVGAKTA